MKVKRNGRSEQLGFTTQQLQQRTYLTGLQRAVGSPGGRTWSLCLCPLHLSKWSAAPDCSPALPQLLSGLPAGTCKHRRIKEREAACNTEKRVWCGELGSGHRKGGIWGWGVNWRRMDVPKLRFEGIKFPFRQ